MLYELFVCVHRPALFVISRNFKEVTVACYAMSAPLLLLIELKNGLYFTFATF